MTAGIKKQTHLYKLHVLSGDVYLHVGWFTFHSIFISF